MIRLITLATLALLLWPSVVGADSYVWGTGSTTMLFETRMRMNTSSWAGPVDSGACVYQTPTGNSTSGNACTGSTYLGSIAYAHDFRITEIVLIPLGVGSSTTLPAGTGCQFDLTIDDGTSSLSGSVVNMPKTDSTAQVVGEVISTAANILVPAGTVIQGRFGDGPNSETGGAGTCVATAQYIVAAQVWGYWE